MNTMPLSPSAKSAIASIKAAAVRLPNSGSTPVAAIRAIRAQAARLMADAAALDVELYAMELAEWEQSQGVAA